MITVNAMLGSSLALLFVNLALYLILRLRCKLKYMRRDRETLFLMIISISEDLNELSRSVECNTLRRINTRVQSLEEIMYSEINPNSAKRAADPLGVSNSDS